MERSGVSIGLSYEHEFMFMFSATAGFCQRAGSLALTDRAEATPAGYGERGAT
ncbi:MAG: hypothetical protein NVSMB19_24350 [Vulcanimicrobiaceae bacterium]